MAGPVISGRSHCRPARRRGRGRPPRTRDRRRARWRRSPDTRPRLADGAWSPARARAPPARAAGSRAAACGSGTTRRTRRSAASSLQGAAGRRWIPVDPSRHRTAARSGARGSMCGSGTRSRARSGAPAPRTAGSRRRGGRCRRRSARTLARTSGSEHRERQQRRPPFGLPRQAGRRFGRQPQPELASKPDGLALVHCELGGTDLEE